MTMTVTDADWSRLATTISRVAQQVDDAGRDDLHWILDFIDRLAGEDA